MIGQYVRNLSDDSRLSRLAVDMIKYADQFDERKLWGRRQKRRVVYSMLSGSDHMQSNREFRCHTVLMTVKTTQIFISLSVISQNMQNKHQLSVTFSFTQQLL